MKCTYCKRRIDLDGMAPAWHSVHSSPELPEDVVGLLEPEWYGQLVSNSTMRPYCRSVDGQELSPCFVAWMRVLKADRRADSAAGEAFRS